MAGPVVLGDLRAPLHVTLDKCPRPFSFATLAMFPHRMANGGEL